MSRSSQPRVSAWLSNVAKRSASRSAGPSFQRLTLPMSAPTRLAIFALMRLLGMWRVFRKIIRYLYCVVIIEYQMLWVKFDIIPILYR